MSNPLRLEKLAGGHVVKEVLREGTGEKPCPQSKVTVHYTGRLENGIKFDSSRDRGQPFSFRLGVGQVIKGWDSGVGSMRKGELCRLIVPPDYAYGDSAVSNLIPAKSTLIFEVELLEC